MNRTARIRALRTILAMAASALLLTFGLAAPAAAAGLVASNVCTNDGGGTFDCFVSISGGTAPYTVTFTAVQNTTITFQSGQAAGGTCSTRFVGSSIVGATVTDSVGNHAAASGGHFLCKQVAS